MGLRGIGVLPLEASNEPDPSYCSVKAHHLGSGAISKFHDKSLRAKSRSLHEHQQSTSGRFLDYARNRVLDPYRDDGP